MRKIFLTHGHYDLEFALVLSEVLKSLGFEVFSASSVSPGITIGEQLSHEIREHMRNADAVVAIISKSSLESSWLLFEIGVAWGMGKQVIPILIRGMQYEDIPPTLSGVQALRVDTKDDFTRAGEMISQAVEH